MEVNYKYNLTWLHPNAIWYNINIGMSFHIGLLHKSVAIAATSFISYQICYYKCIYTLWKNSLVFLKSDTSMLTLKAT